MEVTASFWQLPGNRNKVQIPAQQHCLTKKAEDAQPGAKESPAKQKKAGAALYKGRWQDRYQRWRANQNRRRKAPYAAQWRCLDAVHRRCVLEYNEERKNRVNSSDEDPMLALFHAPPGHGKSQLIECIRSYFETVWD